jgi:SAM-dependent methyltransferase
VAATTELPLPPLELRELVGLTDPAGWTNFTGDPIWPDLPPEAWRFYVDFGCGCGRSARRLLQQRERPRRYLGIDLNREMIAWAQANLAPADPGFSFVHHDVYSAGLNPDPRRPLVAPLPVDDGACSLMEAWSVFTHLAEAQAEWYLDEVARVLAPDGILMATWFLFDKVTFPFMQEFQNALYINEIDPTNAVVFDRAWLRAALAHRGLVIDRAAPPEVRGFAYVLRIRRIAPGVEEVELPEDDAPVGLMRPPTFGATAEGRLVQRPPLQVVAAELESAKERIASLEAERARLTAELEALRAQVTPARVPSATLRAADALRGVRRRLGR